MKCTHRTIGGVRTIVCGSKRFLPSALRCKHGNAATRLCDHPLDASGRTCDEPLCGACMHEREGKDYCAAHVPAESAP